MPAAWAVFQVAGPAHNSQKPQSLPCLGVEVPLARGGHHTDLQSIIHNSTDMQNVHSTSNHAAHSLACQSSPARILDSLDTVHWTRHAIVGLLRLVLRPLLGPALPLEGVEDLPVMTQQ